MRDFMTELPPYWAENKEMRAIQEALETEVGKIEEELRQPLLDSFLDDASEERIGEWEKALSVTPTGTLVQRKLYLKALMRGSGKLNEEKIQLIVGAFTGGRATVSFADGTITVQVLPPDNGEIYLFPDVERALRPRVPAHLELRVVRYYSTWGDVAGRVSSWSDLAERFRDWKEVSNYVEAEGW